LLSPWIFIADNPKDNLMASISIESSQNKTKAAIFMFCVLLLSYVVNAMDRLIFPLLLVDVRKEYGFTIYDAGLLSTIFTLGLAASGVPTGYLLARLSRKAVLQIGIFIFSAGTAITILAHGLADMLVYRAVTGIGEAMQVTVLITIASNYFVNHRSAAVGSLGFTYGLGAIVGPVFASFLLAQNGTWRFPILVFAALGFVAMVLIAFLVKPWFSEVVEETTYSQAGNVENRLFNHNIKVLTCLSVLWGLALYAFFGLYPTYLREGLGYSPAEAASVMSIFGIGSLGSVVGGWIGDRISARVLLVSCFLLSAILSYILFLGSLDRTTLSFVAFVWGIVGAGAIFTNLIAYHVKALPAQLSSRGAGLFVTTFYGAGSLSGYILGYLVHLSSWQTASRIQLVGIAIVAAAVSLLIRPEALKR
jgi:MFS transporter, DHA1 family, inner membrane transport protein